MTQPPAEHPETTAASSSQPSTPHPPGPKVTAPPLGIRPPRPSSTRSTTTATGEDSSAGYASGDAPAPFDPLDESGATPSSPEPPADDLTRLQLKKKPLAEVLRGLVLGAAFAAHQSLARTYEEQAAGVWLMDEPEAAGVADPLANIANRHAGAALVNPDMNDLIAAGVAAASYVVSNVVAAFKIRRAVRRAGHTEPEENAA